MTKKKVESTRLSYSSAKLLQSCSQKYWHYKVNFTEKDADVSRDETHFAVGKAFHQVLEDMNHVYDDNTLEFQVVKCCKLYEVEEYQALIHSMVLKYYKLHNKTGLRAIVNEIELSNDIFVGYVDSVMVDPNGVWWVVDLKTTASIVVGAYVTLERDVQLSLYASFAEEISKNAQEMGENLTMENFGGVRYRVTSKPKLKRKITEDYNSYVLRLAKSCRSLDIVIPKARLQPEKAYARHLETHKLSLQLRDGTVKPVKNFGSCFSYFRPCEYFSQCHGSTASEIAERLEIIE